MLNLNFGIRISDQPVREFLLDPVGTVYTSNPEIPPRYTHDPKDVRPSGAPKVSRQTVPYLVEELWQLVQDGQPLGVNRVLVSYSQDLDITVDYWLLLTALSPAQSAHCRKKFAEYDPAIHGDDIQQWVTGQLAGIVTDSDFKVDAAVSLTKSGKPTEDNTEQRDALFAIYGADNGSKATGRFKDGLDYSLAQWGRDHKVSWVQVGSELPARDKPKLNSNVAREVAKGADVEAIVDGIVSIVIPGDCGPMSSHNEKVLTLGSWPELMVEWVPTHVKIGCSEIIISLPVIRTRTSSLNFYFYYSTPSNTGFFIVKVCTTCAERAAITGTVLGLITTQIEVAAAAFIRSFTSCVESEIKRCIDPGLLLLIEPDGPWR